MNGSLLVHILIWFNFSYKNEMLHDR